MSETGLADAASTTGPQGLTAAEVDQRVRAGQVNVADDRTSRTIGEILRANLLTRFNAILGTAFVLILVFGDARDSLFGYVLVFNALIGIVQEWRAKRTLDRLAVLNAPRARVVRNGAAHEIDVTQVVLGDLCDLLAGDQVPADGVLRSQEGLELDESMLTGESDPVTKVEGDEVLSGSIVVAGRGRFQATHVGADAYARRIATEARRFTLTQSELMDGINTILRYVQWALFPTAILLAFSQFHVQDTTRAAIEGIVAGVVAMVPEGLVLLTSLAFGVATIALARRQVLVQELPAVEGLARVDIVLLDKTGTLTEGVIRFEHVQEIEAADPVSQALGALADDDNRNATMNALCEAFPAPDGLGAHGRDPVLVGPQVERGHLPGEGHVGARRTRDGVDRPGSAGAGGGQPARGRWSARAVAGPVGRGAGRGATAGRADRVGAARVRGEGPPRRGRHPALLRRAGRALHGDLG